MRNKSLIFLLILTILTSCGYVPIFSTKDIDFSISKIEINNKNNISSKIERSLDVYKNLKNKPKNFDVRIDANKKIIISSKDSKGNPSTYTMKIEVTIAIIEGNKTVKKKNLIESFTYNNDESKFTLRQYEKTIEKNLIDKIKDKIKIYLYSL